MSVCVEPNGTSVEKGEPDSAFAFQDSLADKLAADAKSLRPLLESKAAEHEEKGELSVEVIDALQQMGAFRMAGPSRVGGLAQSGRSLANVAVELAKGCPSASWVYTIYNSCFWLASKLPPAMQASLFADDNPRICSPQNGTGQLVPDGDGYRLTGRWNYATGSHHAAITMVPAITQDEQPMLVILPMTSVNLEYTWQVAGMKGTGSDTVVVNDVSVDSANVCPFSDIISATPPRTVDSALVEPSDYWVNYPILRAKALGVLVGCAEGLLEAIVAKSGGPIIYSSYAHKSDSAAYRFVAGEAASKICASRQLMELSCARIDAIATDRRVLSVDERTEFRGQGAFIVQTLTDVVDRLMDLGGSSAFATAGAAQRYWRDFHAASRHVIFNSQISYEAVGSQLLGVESPIPVLDHI